MTFNVVQRTSSGDTPRPPVAADTAREAQVLAMLAWCAERPRVEVLLVVTPA